jgi:hypothetical protein
VLYYDVISLLTLASSSLTLTVHIIGRFYQTIYPRKITTPSGSHPLQFKPDNDREFHSSDGNKGRLPEVVVVPQKAEDIKVAEINKRASTSSFKEMI